MPFSKDYVEEAERLIVKQEVAYLVRRKAIHDKAAREERDMQALISRLKSGQKVSGVK